MRPDFGGSRLSIGGFDFQSAVLVLHGFEAHVHQSTMSSTEATLADPGIALSRVCFLCTTS